MIVVLEYPFFSKKFLRSSKNVLPREIRNIEKAHVNIRASLENGKVRVKKYSEMIKNSQSVVVEVMLKSCPDSDFLFLNEYSFLTMKNKIKNAENNADVFKYELWSGKV